MSTSEHTIAVNTSEAQETITAQQLLKVHEEQETNAQKDTKIEQPTTAEHIDSISALYETNFPSLSASSVPATKPSLTWGAKTGAAAVRSGMTLGSVGENRNSATSEATAPVAMSHRQLNPVVKKPIIVTELLELPASQQLQKKEFGNKTTTVDVVKRVKDRTNTHIEVSTGQKTGNTTFLIKGKHEDVMRAKRDLLDNLAVKVSIF
jgi:DNA polymerase II small subunit/DNA polymerase delta subunit B